MSARTLGLSLFLAPLLVLPQQGSDSQKQGRPQQGGRDGQDEKDGKKDDEKAASFEGRGFLAVRAGTIHLVEDGRVLENGTILIRNGRIQAVGTELEVPEDATVVDYGPDAVIVPGLVAAFSSYALGWPSERTADPSLSALDGFDPYRAYPDALSGGVTSAYVTPAEYRLIAGTGAMVKLAGKQEAARVLNATAAIHGAIDDSARSTPGYWEPPIPVAPDMELGYARPQLPRTTMGAIVALDELLDGSAKPDDPVFQAEYGRRAAAALSSALAARVPLRISAVDGNEIRALLDFAARRHVPLILDRADGAGQLAAEIAAAGVPVVFRLPYGPNGAAFDRGKDEDARWPTLDVPAQLVKAGVRVAVCANAPRDLLFAARLASRGGLDPAAALRAVTLSPAEILGAAERVGSLRPGKDADLCVLNGDPLAPGSSVLAAWVDGEVVWKAHDDERATVLEVDELHVGDGRVLRPGQLLMRAGHILEVGERVSHPRGATVVRGKACMPGMIDALGHLGLEGSRKVPNTDYALESIVEPGDAVDRRVARNGITTVVLSPRGSSDGGAPLLAYKPAATEFEGEVLGDPVALRLRWEDSNHAHSGQNVRTLLAKARDYRTKWQEYEKALAAWTPPKEAAPEEAATEAKKEEDDKKSADSKEGEKSGEKGEEKKDEKAGEEKKADDKKTGEKSDEKKDDSKSKKKKKDQPEELEPDPITGVWQAAIVHPTGAAPATLKLRVQLATPGQSAKVTGNLRCDAASSTLVEIDGWFDREKRTLDVSGLGSLGWVKLAATLAEGKLTGKLSIAGQEADAALEHASKEFRIAKRPERVAKKDEAPKEPKGKPKEPKRDAKLEPLRRAMDGDATVIIEVSRAIDIVPCVDAFSEVGIQPVLLGAGGVYEVLDQVVGRVAGILLSATVLDTDPKRGTDYRTPYADLQNAGVRVAFLSEAEEGAIDLPLRAAYAVANGMSPEGALRALTADAAEMMTIGGRVGRLETGLDADVLLLDGAPLDPATSVLRTWVNGNEVEAP